MQLNEPVLRQHNALEPLVKEAATEVVAGVVPCLADPLRDAHDLGRRRRLGGLGPEGLERPGEPATIAEILLVGDVAPPVLLR